MRTQKLTCPLEMSAGPKAPRLCSRVAVFAPLIHISTDIHSNGSATKHEQVAQHWRRAVLFRGRNSDLAIVSVIALADTVEFLRARLTGALPRAVLPRSAGTISKPASSSRWMTIAAAPVGWRWKENGPSPGDWDRSSLNYRPLGKPVQS